MKRLACSLVLLLACSRGTAPAPRGATPVMPLATPAVASGAGRVLTERWKSEALGVDKDLVVYLPGGYDTSPSTRYPVVYLLHGLGGNETNWVKLGGLAEAADALVLPAIVVMPDGDASFYANSVTAPDYDACLKGEGIFNKQEPAGYCVRSARYEDYIAKDLIAHIDMTYRTVATREGRVIAGLSMGGFGALMLAMRHPDLFSAAASHSGVDALLYAGPWPYDADKAHLTDDVSNWGKDFEPIGWLLRGIFGPDLANWKAHDPAVMAASVGHGLGLYLDVGDADDMGLDAGARYLDAALAKAGVEHAFTVIPGGKHDFVLWKDRIDDSLGFFAARFAAAGLTAAAR
jgi:S-formylglutathione hydrolase FrmB